MANAHAGRPVRVSNVKVEADAESAGRRERPFLQTQALQSGRAAAGGPEARRAVPGHWHRDARDVWECAREGPTARSCNSPPHGPGGVAYGRASRCVGFPQAAVNSGGIISRVGSSSHARARRHGLESGAQCEGRMSPIS